MHEESEEARHWHEGDRDDGGTSPPRTKTIYGSLEDPWKAKDGEDA